MSSHVVRRRTILRAAALGPVGGLAAGCAELARVTGLGDPVRVAVSWSATELAAFQRVLGARADDCELVPLGDDIDAALGANATYRLDMVAVPRPKLVLANVDRLAPLPDDVWKPDYDEIWPGGLAARDGRHYALPFKLAHASVVWYRKSLFAEHGLRAPTNWSEWLDLNDRITEQAGIAPLALGGADGWLLAQFFANVLLRHFDGTYDALVRGAPGAWAAGDVRAAFGMVAAMWGRPDALSGGAERALVAQFPEAVLAVFHHHEAAMVPAPDFAESVIREFDALDDDVDKFTFPAAPGLGPRLVATGDLLVLTAPSRPAAGDLIRHLSGPEAPVPWITGTGGFIAANRKTDLSHYTQNLRELAMELRSSDPRFDLSDQVVLGDVLKRVLQDLLRALAAGTAPAAAADTAARAMADAERAAP
ncbi:MAG TPA: ABC transporter substrate-binding protein [Actinophytocola sp.]|nr:ABC transporter substrate-binding protein [Actinophytocola sp.]